MKRRKSLQRQVLQKQSNINLLKNKSDDKKQVRNYAFYLLARRDYSQFELKQKLMSRYAQESFIDELIEELVSAGWVDDARYVESFVRSKSEKCFGPNYIRYELERKGITDDYLNEQLASGDVDWTAQATSLLKKRLRGKDVNQEILIKQKRYLYQRGFEPEQIKMALDQVTSFF